MLQAALTHADGTTERTVEIASSDICLRGVLGFPKEETATLAVLCLHGWGGGRSGPHDLLVQVGRHLNGAGFYTLRFDFADRGESDGLSDGANLDQMGEDALAAAELLLAETGCSKLMVLGMCSGGNVGIGVLDRLPSCVGLLLLSVYPFSEGDSFGRQSHRTASAAKGYFRKAMQLHTWKRLFRGAIDFKSIFSVLFGHYKTDDSQVTAAEREGASPLDNLRARSTSVRMIYGDADPDTAASLRHYQEFAKANNLPMTFDVVAGADHNFYSLQHTENLAKEASSFARGL